MLVPPNTVDLDLRELFQKPVEAGSEEKLRHAWWQGSEAGAGAVVVEELEPAALSGAAVVARGVGGSAAEDDDRVEG